jgi:hypothetical protein
MTFVDGTKFLLGMEIVMAIVAYFCISRTLKGVFNPHMRRIAGLDSIEEAVGRATEMGRPVHFCPGIGGITDTSAPQTFAGLSVLQFVTELTAKYNTDLICTIRTAVVFPVAQEIVRQAYVSAGKPDMFKEDTVRYLSGEQFAYAAGVMGIFFRERVAANIMMGAFWAESLLFAEAGSQAGAIQVAGSASLAQIPFFVAACDYTLIGEELYAGGAYLSQDKMRLGSIAGQDFIKAGVMAYLLLGTILATAGVNTLATWLTK